LDHTNLQIFLTIEVIRATCLECIFSKIEKIIQRVEWEIPILKLPREKHVFPHISLSNYLFGKWGKYNEENVRATTPSSPEVWWRNNLHGFFAWPFSLYELYYIIALTFIP
jgi:hypothetical protein